MSNSTIKYKRLFTTNGSSGGGGGGIVASVVAGRNITVDNTDPANPIVATTADDIIVVANYSALPLATLHNTEFYFTEASQGTPFVGALWGGAYYPAGLYYSNGVSWVYMDTPSQATQAEVNAGTVTNKFVTPETLTSWSGLGNYVPYTGATGDVTLGTFNLTTPKIIGGTAVGSQLTLQGTSGNGTSTVAAIVGNVGNNGATNAFNVYNDGKILIGTSTRAGGSLSKVRIGDGTNLLDIGSYNGSNVGLWSNQATPDTSNPFMLIGTNQTYVNAAVSIFLTIGVNTKIRIDNGFVNIEKPTLVGSVAGITPSAMLQIRSTTEQFRVEYDASNYYSTTVSSTGGVTFNAVGSGSSFTFSDNVINGALLRLKGYTVATLPTGTIGDTAYCTDLLTPTFLALAVGGGAIVGKVFYNGTQWITA